MTFMPFKFFISRNGPIKNPTVEVFRHVECSNNMFVVFEWIEAPDHYITFKYI